MVTAPFYTLSKYNYIGERALALQPEHITFQDGCAQNFSFTELVEPFNTHCTLQQYLQKERKMVKDNFPLAKLKRGKRGLKTFAAMKDFHIRQSQMCGKICGTVSTDKNIQSIMNPEDLN